MNTLVISLGGSLIHKHNNFTLLNSLRRVLSNRNFVIVTGGGSVARYYQDVLRHFSKSSKDLDDVGIFVTKLNAFLISKILHAKYIDFKDITYRSKRVVLGGLKPGVTTDYVAVRAASILKSNVVVNMSKIRFVRIKGSSKNFISWAEYFKLLPDKNTPGIHIPFDVKASELAKKLGIKVLFINNPQHIKQLYNIPFDTDNLKKFMKKKGTLIY